MHVENMIYLYLFICLGMLAFNTVFALSRKGADRRFSKKADRLFGLLHSRLEEIKKGDRISPKLLDRLGKRLGNYRELMAFHEGVLRLRKEDAQGAQQLLSALRPMFIRLAVDYSRKNEMKKAYFAYLMAQYRVERSLESSPLAGFMLTFAESQNAYCRENALQALYAFGNAPNVARAIYRLSSQGIHHHNKLLTDGLASFSGDHQELCGLLWKLFPELTEEYQLVVVNYVRMVSGAYRQEFLGLLTQPETDKEVALAIIRYLRTYPCEEAKPVLLELLARTGEDHWEYAAIAAQALQAYPGQQTVDALKAALSSPNWYIRYNSAESLRAMGVGYLDLIDIYNGEDRFAREMLTFQMQKGSAPGRRKTV